MVGLYTGDVVDAPELRAQAPPSSTADVLGAVWGESVVRSPVPSLVRLGALQNAESGYLDEYGREVMEPGPRISKSEANDRFGIEGHLSFDGDTSELRAQTLNEMKRAELDRSDVLQRAKGGFLEGAGKLGVGLVSTVLDPLNVAASFIPVVGQARYAAALAGAGGAFGRAGVRAAVGAAGGVVGAAAVEPIIATAAHVEQGDYHAVDSLLNLTFGGLAGGVLHAGFGAVGDRISGRYRSTSPMGRAVDQVAAMPPEVREAALRAAISQTAEGKPVDVSAFLHTAEVLGGRTVNEGDLARLDELERRLRADDPVLNDMLDTLRGKKAAPDLGPTVLSELRKFGTIKDEGGELAAMDLAKQRPGLVSKNGRSLEDATLHLWERGFFPEHPERPTPEESLLPAIEEELAGRPRYHPENAAAQEHAGALHALDEQLSRLGINPEHYSNAELQAILHGVGPAAEHAPRTAADLEREDAAFRDVVEGKNGAGPTRNIPGEADQGITARIGTDVSRETSGSAAPLTFAQKLGRIAELQAQRVGGGEEDSGRFFRNLVDQQERPAPVEGETRAAVDQAGEKAERGPDSGVHPDDLGELERLVAEQLDGLKGAVDRGLISPAELEAVRAATEGVEKAKAMGAAFEQAATCLTGRV